MLNPQGKSRLGTDSTSAATIGIWAAIKPNERNLRSLSLNLFKCCIRRQTQYFDQEKIDRKDETIQAGRHLFLK